jgi:hypothetical protein
MRPSRLVSSGSFSTRFSIGVRMQPHIRAAVEQIPEETRVTLEDYPNTSIAQIAETTPGDWLGRTVSPVA